MANRYLAIGTDRYKIRATGTIDVTTSSTYTGGDGYAAYAIGGNTPSNYWFQDFTDGDGVSDAATTGEDLWLHWYFRPDGASTDVTNYFWQLVNASDQPWFAIRQTASGLIAFYYNSNTGASPTWTLLNGDVSWIGGVTVDVKITLGSPHAYEIYIDSALTYSGTFTQSGFTSADAVRTSGINSRRANTREFLATVGVPTVTARVAMTLPSGAGTTNTFDSGTATSINDYSDATYLASATAAQRATFAYANLPTLSGAHIVGETRVLTRGLNAAGAPQSLQIIRRDSGGTETDSATKSLTGGFSDVMTSYSGAVDEAEFNASEFGVESIT